MAELQAYVAQQNKKSKGTFLSSSATESDSDSVGLLSWVPSSVNISMPNVLRRDGSDKTESTWFSEAKKDPLCPALVRLFWSTVIDCR